MQLSSEACTLLRSAVRNHPNLPDLIDSRSALVDMTNEQIIALARKLNLDIAAVISATEKLLPDLPVHTIDDVAVERYSEEHPAFTGHIAFDLEVGLFRQVIKRNARLVFEHTPDWAYYNLIERRVMFGWEMTKWKYEVLAPSNTETREATSDGAISIGDEEEWEEMQFPDAVHSDELWEAILEAIDAISRQEDLQRRAKRNPPS